MLILSDSPVRLRDACTRNNAHWLRSFGCRIEERDGCQRVWNDLLDDYRAWIVPGLAAGLDRTRIDFVCADAASASLTVYVDSPASRAWIDSLSRHGFEPQFRSVVRALPAIRRRRSPAGGLVLTEVSGDEFASWATLYGRVFSTDPAIEQQRWARAARDANLRHYTFHAGGESVGLCQLCLSDGIAGLYSMGLLPQAPRGTSIHLAARLVVAEAADRGFKVVYFERVRPAGAEAPSASARIVRAFQAWVPRKQAPMDGH